MDQEKIKAARKKLWEKIQEHEGSITVLHAQMRVLQARCSHPNKYSYTAMGDPGEKCPDCGYQT